MAGVSRQRTGIPGRDALDHHAARAALAVEVRLPAPSLRANGAGPTGSPEVPPSPGCFDLILGSLRSKFLEGWRRVHALCPSVETLASQAPQDEVDILL